LHDPWSSRSLHGDECILITAVGHRRLRTIMLRHPLKVLADIRRIDTDKEVIVCHAIKDNVIDNATVGITHQRILCLSKLDAGNISHNQFLQGIKGVWTTHLEFTHVAEIKEPSLRTHGVMFGEDATILHWHVPATELDHTSTEGAMGFVEGSAFGHTSLGVASSQ
jgi:hypothetical protein